MGEGDGEIMTALLLTAILTCADFDLGVVTDRMAISLEKCKVRTDFAVFKLELLQGTNTHVLYMTNDIVTLADLKDIDDGKAIMGVRSICKDGTESPVSAYRFIVRRQPPTAPLATPIVILSTNYQTTNLAAIMARRSITNKPLVFPPTPPGAFIPRPLPGARSGSETYQEYRIREAQETGRRRNE